MKLLTEMCRDDNGEMYANDPDPYQAKGAVARDAAAAHALMLAMDGIRSEWVPDGPPILSEIVTRADELLREWGFDSGEGI